MAAMAIFAPPSHESPNFALLHFFKVGSPLFRLCIPQGLTGQTWIRVALPKGSEIGRHNKEPNEE